MTFDERLAEFDRFARELDEMDCEGRRAAGLPQLSLKDRALAMRLDRRNAIAAFKKLETRDDAA